MNMQRTSKAILLGVTSGFLLLAEVCPEAPLGVTFAREAAAIVGRPATPMSVAGVARRTTVRVATTEAVVVTSAAAASSATAASTAQQQQAVAKQQAATAQQQATVAQQQAAVAQQQAQAAGVPAIGTVVSALPAGCTAVASGGIEYQKCGGAFYRTAFQGANLVYVSVAQP